MSLLSPGRLPLGREGLPVPGHRGGRSRFGSAVPLLQRHRPGDQLEGVCARLREQRNGEDDGTPVLLTADVTSQTAEETTLVRIKYVMDVLLCAGGAAGSR